MCHISTVLSEDTTLLIMEGLQIEAKHLNGTFKFEIRGLKGKRQLIKGEVTDESIRRSSLQRFQFHVNAWGFDMLIGLFAESQKFILMTNRNENYWRVNSKK